MNYCKKCVLPNTRPNLIIDEHGRCNCSFRSGANKIDWLRRADQFQDIVREVKSHRAEYDCVIPVSGGKDSTWQVVKALEYGLKPLCVTWRTPFRTKLGERNLLNLISLGVDHIDFTINPLVERKFARITFEKVGSPAVPMHLAIHAIPLKLCIQYKVPLIIWGENSAFEYGGQEEDKGFELTERWLKNFGVSNGTVAEDWACSDLTLQELAPYRRPKLSSSKRLLPKAIFLGHFFEWDPLKTYEFSKQYGFAQSSSAKTGFYKFADIDEQFIITIHHWMKWYKFGFTRLWDNLSLEIRNGRLSRNEAIDILKNTGSEQPLREIRQFCEYVGMQLEEFIRIAESHRNTTIWYRDANDRAYIKDFLIEDWNWGDEVNFK